MALDISGIGNVGEFFSQHYLDALLEKDLKDTLSRWAKRKTEDKVPAPQDCIARLADPYFRLAARAEGVTDASERLALTESFHADLLTSLGYERHPTEGLLDDERMVPLLYAEQQNHKPWLWIIEAPFPVSADDADPFGESPLPAQVPIGGLSLSEAPLELATESWRELLDGPIFRAENPPRWVIFVAGSDVFLLDRDKWHQGKYLHFQLGRLLGLREPKSLQATAGLLHREVLLPDGGQSLLEKLDEESHKHAFAVSTDLKFGAQRAIELLGNEAVRYRLEIQKKKTYDDELDVRELTRECITYLYRLLFLFYVEARGPELGVVPMQSDAFRLGYSLESLRDLELVPLTTDEARNGTFLSESLRQLFHLVQRGHGLGQGHLAIPDGIATAPSESEPAARHETFLLRGLRSPLFDEERTPILRAVKFKNQTIQEVLRLLSLSREGKGKARGRISYAQLGINQLGAVYEGLLSYTGFFASEELHEVRDEAEMAKDDARTYFVPASKIEAYKKAELVKDEHGRPLKHPKGTFLFRLSGRDRERSASYYTPEVLTRCLAKYTLKVRLGEPLLPEDDTAELRAKRLSADEILKLTICEPAMGSGAFLNEAVSQLAEKYLEKKQTELGKTIPADEYQVELAKVKYHFVVHNVYGVDLNPLAAELGKISLWLNVLQPDVEAPYLDQRLAVGNSLIGARREVFAGHLLTARGNTSDSWLSAVPERVPLRDAGAEPGDDLQFPTRPKSSVYHFLVPDQGMVAYADDDVVKDLRKEESEKLRAWRKAQAQPFTELDVTRLVGISDRVDDLWKAWAEERVQRQLLLRQPIQLWGQTIDEQLKAGARTPDDTPRYQSVEEAEELIRGRERPMASGARLKLVMDYWGALWFWPVLQADLAPSRDEWLHDIEAILEGGEGALRRLGGPAEGRLDAVHDVASEQRFFHWQLAFAEVFAQRGGMDVFLGNPPWVKVEWSESGVLGDIDPLLNLRKLSAKQVADLRREMLAVHTLAEVYLGELAGTQGQAAFIASGANYPLLRGVHGNLYKCFLEGSWRALAPSGAVGLWHQPGLFDDPSGGALRREYFARGVLALRFKNELLLFSEIANQRSYMATVSVGPSSNDHYILSSSNLLHPRTFDDSLAHDGTGQVPGIKTSGDSWDLRGHRSRIVRVDQAALGLFAKLYDSAGTPPLEARLPIVHSAEILKVLERFASAARTLGTLGENEVLCISEHLHESRQQVDGTIRRETRFAKSPDEWVVSGPHFYVATPFNKTPNEECNHNKDYTSLDLTLISEDYLPRTNYVPACSAAEYRELAPRWDGKRVTEFYRYVNRRMIAPTGERTLVPAVIPPGAATIDLVFAVAFKRAAGLMAFAAIAASLPIDFFVKSTGKGDARNELLLQIPLLTPETASLGSRRSLRLNCLTTHYADLWEEVATEDIATDGFAKQDARLPSWQHLTPKWSRESALRTPYERRQALVELDALAALSLGLTVEQLQLIYRVQFPVLQQYERETYYDQRGKIVFTTNRGLSGVGLDRKQWEEVQHATAGDKLPAWAKDAGGAFVPPFDSCDRESDMAQAYRHFQERLAQDSVDDLPTVIPNLTDGDHAVLFICALLHAWGGTAVRMDLAHAFMLRAHPDLVKRLAPGSLKREVRHWVSSVGSRSVKVGLLASTLSALAQGGSVRPGTNREGRATVSTSSRTPAQAKIHSWIRFEADLVMRVLRAQPEEKRTAIDEALSDADRKLLESAG